MKIPLHSVPIHCPGSSRRRERGTALVVVLLYLAIVFVYIVSNARTLHCLGRELRLIEHRQIRRLAAPPAQGRDRTTKDRGWMTPAGTPPQQSRSALHLNGYA